MSPGRSVLSIMTWKAADILPERRGPRNPSGLHPRRFPASWGPMRRRLALLSRPLRLDRPLRLVLPLLALVVSGCCGGYAVVQTTVADHAQLKDKSEVVRSPESAVLHYL